MNPQTLKHTSTPCIFKVFLLASVRAASAALVDPLGGSVHPWHVNSESSAVQTEVGKKTPLWPSRCLELMTRASVRQTGDSRSVPLDTTLWTRVLRGFDI